jgi:hypothetical protein
MRLEVTPLKNFWLIKRQNDSVPGLVILIALTTMSLIPLLLYLPNNVDIRHSASLGFNYDILDNLKFQWEVAMANRIPLIEGNETVKR